MGAFDGLFLGGYSVTERDTGRVYVRGQPAFNFTREFTLKDLMRLNEAARREGKDHVYVKSGGSGISGARLDLWYSEALVRNEMAND